MSTRAGEPTTNRLPVRHILMLASCAALVAGALQVIVVVVRRDLLHEFTFTSRDVFWMAPLANLMLVLPLAGFLAALSRVVSYRIGMLAASFTLACYAAYCAVLLFPRIAQYAMVILTLAVAYQFAFAVSKAPERAFARIRRLTTGLVAVLAIVAILQVSWAALRERRALAALPTAPAEAPNVLLLILDTVRASSLSLYGYDRTTTPELDRRAPEGVVFNWAIATSSWTLPSHGSMFTGRRPDELSARLLDPLDRRHATLAEVFRDHGYATGGFIANYNYTTHESGLDRGFTHYADYRRSLAESFLTGALSRTDSFRDAYRGLVWNRSLKGAVKAMLAHHFVSTVRYPDVDRKRAEDVNAEFLEWQASLGGRPFFAFLNYFDAHTPYRPPADFREHFASNPKAQDLYDANIRYIDREIANLMRELERRGVLDRTLFVIASDHGEQFGEHGKLQHANSLYIQSTRVPLLMRFPNHIPKGLRVDRVLTLQDLPSTLLELAAIEASGQIGGTSFAALAAGREGEPGSPVATELEEHVGFGEGNDTPEIRAIFDDSLHLIVGGGKPEQLYAYRTDSLEAVNLAPGAAAAADLARLRAELRRVTSPQPYVLRPRK